MTHVIVLEGGLGVSGPVPIGAMQQQFDVLTVEDCGKLDGQFVMRAQRLNALLDLDRALSAAANRHNLAAQVVHYGWPHRAD